MKPFSDQPRTYLQVASEWGLFIGIAACVAVFATLFSIYKPYLMIPAIAGYVAVPVLAWRMLKGTFIATDATASTSILWRTGTLAFSAGGLITALVVFIVFKWIDPGFVARMFDDVMKMYSSLDTPDAAEKLDQLRQIAEQGLPTSAQMAMQIFVFTVLSGSVLSLIIAAILRARANAFRSTPPKY